MNYEQRKLDELYFVWLYGQVADPSESHRKLLKQIYEKPFSWIVPFDDNRIEEGKHLRREFLQSEGLGEVDQDWMEMDCSMLELMVGLSRRLEFLVDRTPRHWFWVLMENVGLNKNSYTDNRRIPKSRVDQVLDRVIWRTYEPNGEGGFFPLKWPEKDQRKVELWYQMNAWVIENRLI